MEKNKNLIAVEARNESYYSITESNTRIKRVWQGGNTLYLTEDQIRDLASSYGGKIMFENHLIVHDKELIEDILGYEVEPEYNYDKKTVLALLKDGTEDQLRDALNLAPAGVKELIRLCAIETRIPDMNKRNIISKALDVDLNKTIEFDIAALEDAEEKPEDAKRTTEPFTLNVSEKASKRSSDALFPPMNGAEK